jgi:hypothetical protein
MFRLRIHRHRRAFNGHGEPADGGADYEHLEQDPRRDSSAA